MLLRKLLISLISGIAIFTCHAQPKDSIYFDGHFRNYYYYTPQNYTGANPVPLVFVLHGGGANDGVEMINNAYFEEIGDTVGYITVFPNGLYNDWADGRGVTKADTAGLDDVGFLETLIDSLSATFNINQLRVYVTGASNGGMMVQRLACETHAKFAAFATIIASMSDSVYLKCNPTLPVAMLLMNGTADNWVPYNGGPLNTFAQGGVVIGTDSTINFWRNHNSCTTPSLITNFPNTVLNDSSTVTKYDYPCVAHSDAVLYRVDGGGHTLPGGPGIFNPVPFLGYINKDINAALEIWQFFSQHALPVVGQYEPKEESIFSVFPNPSSGKFKVVAKEDLNCVSWMRVLSANGKLIHKLKFTSNEMMFTIQEAGTYFLITNDCDINTVHKLVVLGN